VVALVVPVRHGRASAEQAEDAGSARTERCERD